MRVGGFAVCFGGLFRRRSASPPQFSSHVTKACGPAWAGARPDLAHQVGVAQRLHAEGRRPQARAPEERTHPRAELLLQRLHARSGEDPSSRTPTDRKCPKRPVAAAGPEARLPPPCSDAPRTRFGAPTRAGRRGSLRVEGCVRAPPSRIRGRPETQPPGLLEAEVPALPLPHPHKHQPVTLPAPVHFVAGPAPLPRIRGARGTQPRSLIMTTPGRSFAHPAAP